MHAFPNIRSITRMKRDTAISSNRNSQGELMGEVTDEAGGMKEESLQCTQQPAASSSRVVDIITPPNICFSNCKTSAGYYIAAFSIGCMLHETTPPHLGYLHSSPTQHYENRRRSSPTHPLPTTSHIKTVQCGP